MWSKPKTHLSFESLRKALSSLFLGLPDSRQEGKRNYSTHDTMMSGFACMYFQDPSLLHFQKQMENSKRRSNMQTLFGVKNTPKDTQMREVIDKVDGECLRPIFKEYFLRLQRAKFINKFLFYEGSYLISLDGTQYFSSGSIN